MPKKRFSEPPLIEVVCGVLFDAIEGLDPVLVGRYWNTQLGAFPRKQLLPAIAPRATEGLVVELAPVPPLRTWLISADDSRVMQIQADRFYLNWRARGEAYPSFNSRDGQPGLLNEVVEALQTFAVFLRDHAGIDLRPTRIELSMIDVLRRQRHWISTKDLSVLLPIVAPLLSGFTSLPPSLQVVVEGPTAEGERRIAIQRALVVASSTEAVRLETTFRRTVSSMSDVHQAFKEAHQQLKDTFDELIPPDQHVRFETGWSPST